eukprot:364475-Chlamydomonas_euryale.AAC.16
MPWRSCNTLTTTFQMCLTFLAIATMRPLFMACSTRGCALCSSNVATGEGWLRRTLGCSLGIHDRRKRDAPTVAHISRLMSSIQQQET